ncbi:MAG: AAA family ATPase [PVC group bacterium]|nr:AAA family ATPase [PVC group bacterium]
MRIIAIANQKGGCGKTTTAINFSACLAQAKKNVLLIDLDPQGHATLGLNIKHQDVDKSMYHVLTPQSGKKVRLDEIILPISQNFDLAPADILLSAIEQELSGKPEREAKLYQAISLMVTKKTYDYIVIDCPPSLGLLTFNALRVSGEVIAPVETGFFSVHGVSKLLEIVDVIGKRLKCDIAVKALITLFDRRTKFSQEIKDDIYNHFSGQVFKSIINTNVRLKEAASYGMPVIAYDKRCRGSEDYMALAKEVIRKYDWTKPETVTETVGGPQQSKSGILFTYSSTEAGSVQIAGDFNNWAADQKDKLETTKKGVWAKVYNLRPGRYRYKFIVDGQWVTDPNNPQTEADEIGNLNSLLEIK